MTRITIAGYAELSSVWLEVWNTCRMVREEYNNHVSVVKENECSIKQ